MTAVGRCYLVVSREYGEVVPILDDGSGPMEYGCDWAYVYAHTKRRARVLAVRWFRRFARTRGRFLSRYDDESPFTGMKVYPHVPDDEEEPSEW